MRAESFELIRVRHIPARPGMLPGGLYFSEEYGVASHLCACGCGEETVTPIKPGEWSLTEGPTLSPSIGNFQIPCRSHYWIRGGKAVWA